MKYIIPFLAIFMAASCSTVRVYSDYDKSVNFENFSEFSFHKKGIESLQLNDIEKKRIVTSLNEHFKSKGYQMDEMSPDIIVNIVFDSRRKLEAQNTGMNTWMWGGFGPWGGGFGMWGMPMMWGGGRTYLNEFAEGTLIVDIIETKSNKLVWQGKGIARIYEDPAKNNKRFQEAIEKIMAKFPIKGNTFSEKVAVNL